MPKYFIYSRKSIYTGRGDSIQNQIELCRNYIAEHVPDASPTELTVFEDEGFSGKNTERPCLQQMLTAIRRGGVQAVVCYRLDRISRNVGDFCRLVELLEEHGTGLVCIRENFNTATPVGRAMMYVSSIFAQLERETIGERVKDNFRLLARTGRWLGGPRPIGFRPEAVQNWENGKSACLLQPVEEEQRHVRRAFALFLTTRSLNGTVRRLGECHAVTKEGKSFSVSSLKILLRNPVYTKVTPEVYDYFLLKGSDLAFDKCNCDGVSGLMTYNRSTVEKSRKVLLDYPNWIVSVGAHAGIIEGADWVRVQKLLDTKAAQCSAARRNTAPPLPGQGST